MPSLWYLPTTPVSLSPTPWLSPKATAYLESILRPEFDVIEFGSGGSTLWMAPRVSSVLSYEHNAKWMEAVRRKAPGNVTVLQSGGPNGAGPYDLIFIDGDPVAERAEWIRKAPDMLKPGGWIVLDNANRPEYRGERERLLASADLVESFDGNMGNTEFLVTEFYQKKGD
jgi:predicted O-methyltransferase YrrM